MRTKELFAAFVVIFLVGTIFSSSFSIAAMYSSRSAVSATYQPAPSFQTTYGSQASTYWPILGNKDTCDSREDFMLQVAPFGCEPKVVRSDLLAEQVLCRVDFFAGHEHPRRDGVKIEHDHQRQPGDRRRNSGR